MTSKSNKKKNNFSCLSMYRVAEEEINKNKSPIKFENNKNNKNINDNKFSQNENKTKDIEKNSRNMNRIRMPLYSSVDNKDFGQIKSQIKINNPKIKVSKEKDKNSINKNSAQTFQAKPFNKKPYKHIDRIIIDLVSNDDNQTNSNYSEKEYLLKNYKTEENEDFAKIKNKDKNINNQTDLKTILNCIINRWKHESKLENEANINLLGDDIFKKKREIEFIVNRWKNQKKINQINFSMLKKEGINEEKEKNNIIYRWKNNLEKDNRELFTIKKSTLNNDIFLYSEKNYIKDLTKNIYLPKNNENIFCILNNDNYMNDFNIIDYRVIKPNNKNELENDINDFYNKKKINYLKNKDNNEELKINPIYILNNKQINQLYENLNKDKNKNNNTFEKSQLIIEKQNCIDYDTIEIFTPKYKNRDNNSNVNTKRNSSYNSAIKSDKVGELKFEGQKRVYKDFGQETPFSMLDDRFYIYAISRNSKYSIPESQSCINYINPNINNKNFSSNILKQNKFCLKIETCEKIDSVESQKTTSKRINEENIIDYSKISGNSNK